MNEKVNNRLKNLIMRSGETQTQIANKCHIPQASMSRYMNNQMTPSMPVLLKIAEVLKVPLEYILGKEVSDFEKLKNDITCAKDSLSDEQKSILVKVLYEK